LKGLPLAARLRQEVFTLKGYREVKEHLLRYACSLT